MDERRRYELYVVFQPDLDDEGVESRIDRVNSAITSNQGEIIEVARRGKRKLAYPINRHTHGIDVLYQANLVGTSVEGLERLFNLSEDVIRYLFVRREDLEKAARQSAAAPRPAEETPAPATSEEGAAARTVDPTEQPQPMEEFAAEGGAAAPAEEAVAPSDEATPAEEAPAEEAVAMSDEAAPAEEAAVEAPVATSDEDAAAPSDTASNE